MRNEPVVQIESLVKRYGTKTAVDGLDLTAGAGITAVLGPNGAGKTTTIETCEGYRKPDSGTVRVLGLDPVREAGALRPRIGVMLQSGGVYSGARADEMLRHVAKLHAHPLDVDALIERLGLGSCGRTTYRQLSGGQQQRLALALAWSAGPQLVFLDEPTAGLDPQARRATWDLVRDLRRDGVAVILTTHHMDEAEELADDVAIIDAGGSSPRAAPTRCAAAAPRTPCGSPAGRAWTSPRCSRRCPRSRPRRADPRRLPRQRHGRPAAAGHRHLLVRPARGDAGPDLGRTPHP